MSTRDFLVPDGPDAMPALRHLDPDTLVGLASGLVDDRDRDLAYDHLASCPSCRDRFIAEADFGETDARFPVLSFFEAVPGGSDRAIEAETSHDPSRGETYHLGPIAVGNALVIAVTSPRACFAEFLGRDDGGWSIVAPTAKLAGRSDSFEARSEPIPGLSTGSVVVVVLTESPATDAILAAIRPEGGTPPSAESWIARLAADLLESGQSWLEAPVVRVAERLPDAG